MMLRTAMSSALTLPSSAIVTALLASAPDAPSNNCAASNVARLREPGCRPVGLPERPAETAHPRCVSPASAGYLQVPYASSSRQVAAFEGGGHKRILRFCQEQYENISAKLAIGASTNSDSETSTGSAIR